jgi:hypothetical protein
MLELILILKLKLIPMSDKVRIGESISKFGPTMYDGHPALNKPWTKTKTRNAKHGTLYA